MSTHILTAADNVACKAFALCTNPAVGAIKHPVLGAYPSCQRCANKLEQVIETAEIINGGNDDTSNSQGSDS